MKTNEQVADPKEAMERFAKPVQGQNAKDFDPMERIPTLTAGDDLLEGGMIAGRFERVERLLSDKFKMSQEVDPATGKKVSRRVIFSRDGQLIGLWLSGALKPAFGDENNPGTIERGSYVELTYVNKGPHPTNDGQTIHNFKFKVTAPVLN